MTGPSLMGLMINAPLIGILKRWPNRLHAVEMDGLPLGTWPKGLARSVCGMRGLRVLASGEEALLWPPYVKGLDQMIRCPECYAGATKKRPRTRFLREPSLSELVREQVPA